MKRIANWVAIYELIPLILISPLLLFPSGAWPFVGALVILLTWSARWLARGRPTIGTPLDLPILILLIMSLVGLNISVVPAFSSTQFWSIFLGVAFYYAIVNSLAVRRNAEAIIIVLSLLAMGGALLGLLWVLPSNSLENIFVPFNLYLINQVIAFILPVPIAYLLFGLSPKLRLLSLVVILVATTTLILTRSIQGVIGLLVALVFLAIWRNRWSLLLIPFFGGLFLTSMLALGPLRFAAYLLTPETWLGKIFVSHLDLWSRGLAMLHDLPYTGIGLDAFQVIQSNFYPGFFLNLEAKVHNLYLQTALDLGLIGLFAFIWLLIAWGRTTQENHRMVEDYTYRVLLAGLAAGVITYLVTGFFAATNFGDKANVIIWIYLGLSVQSPRPMVGVDPKKAQPVSRRLRPIAYPLVLLAALLALYAALVPESFQMNWGAVYAHRAIYEARQTGVAPAVLLHRAEGHLSRANQRNPQNVFVNELLGQVNAWQEEHPRAFIYFDGRVSQDIQAPYRRYYPPQSWLYRLQGYRPAPERNREDLLKIYTQWMQSNPSQAEHYLRLALLWNRYKSSPNQAVALLREGVRKGAQPAGLLEYALEQMQP